MKKNPLCLGVLAAAATVCAASSAAASEDVSQLYLTAYAWHDNSPAGDAISEAGAHNYHARIGLNNSYTNPSTMAAPAAWVSTGDAAGYFKAGDMVHVTGLGWFVIEDTCASCITSYDGSTGNLDMWTGYANSYDPSNSDENSITLTYHVTVFHPTETPPDALKNDVAGSNWHARDWTNSTHQTGSAAPNTPGIWIDGQQVANSDGLGGGGGGSSPALQWGDLLVNGLVGQSNANNAYGTSPSYAYWAGYDGQTTYQNHTECASLVTILMKRGYGLTDANYTAWMGSTSPNAAAYHDAIVAGNKYTRITAVTSLQPGDLLASIYYPVGSSPSGHTALVDAAPAARTASAPLVSGTTQYDVQVVDSTSTPHTNDTRASWAAGGAGRGTMRIYADGTGAIAGYTWSDSSGSVYYSVGGGVRQLVAGRYTP